MPAMPPTRDLALGLNVRMPERPPVPPARLRRLPEESWENEGGSVPPQAQQPPLPAPRPAAPSKNKQSRDTIVGCRLLAKDDLARALGCDTDHGRLKFEHSAATWTERGDMLETLARGRLRNGSKPTEA